jgi:phosphatidylinositol alpha 1,6-mannosyltransferase
MRIAYFSATLKDAQDGVVRVVNKYIETALNKHCSVAVFTASPPLASVLAVPVYRVPSVPFLLQKAYRLALPGTGYFENQLGKFSPDLLHIHSPCTLGYSAARYGIRHHIPVVATYHTHFPAYLPYYHISLLEGLCWRLLRNLYNNITHTIVPSHCVMRDLQDHNIERLIYIPNGVDIDSFNPSYYSDEWRLQFPLGLHKPIILFVSRLVWEKNLKTLAETYNALRSVTDNFIMVVIGDGPARRELQQMMPGAHFLGFLSGHDLSVAYASSDIFVFPSRTESFGLVTVEAMASGLVPVAAGHGGAIDIIENNVSGFLVPPDGTGPIVEKIRILLDHSEIRKCMSVRAHERAKEFSWESILDRLFRLYERIVRSSDKEIIHKDCASKYSLRHGDNKKLRGVSL